MQTWHMQTCAKSLSTCALHIVQFNHIEAIARQACAPGWVRPECRLLWKQTWHICAAHHHVQVAHHPVQIAHHYVQFAALLLLGKEHAAVAAERLRKQPELSTSPPAWGTQHCRGGFAFNPSVLMDCTSKRWARRLVCMAAFGAATACQVARAVTVEHKAYAQRHQVCCLEYNYNFFGKSSATYADLQYPHHTQLSSQGN